jgi:hypothetical protein
MFAFEAPNELISAFPLAMIPGLSCAALDIPPLGVAGKNAPRERPRSNTKAWAHANTHNRSIRTLDLALRRRHCVLIQIFHLWLSRRNWMGFVLSQRRSRSRSSKASNGSAATLVEYNFGCQANCGLTRPGPAREEAGGRLVVEAACSSHRLPCIWAALRKRQRDVSEEAKEFAKNAQQRCTGVSWLAAAGRDKTKIINCGRPRAVGLLCAIGPGAQTRRVTLVGETTRGRAHAEQTRSSLLR